MKTLRIMHISTRLILGGSQENTILSCEGQAEDGHTLSLVHGPIYGPEGTMLARVRAHGGIETIETPRLLRRIAPLTDLRCLGDLRRIIARWHPDVVHTHSSKAGILGRIAAWKQRVPAVIHTIHGLPFHPYQSKLLNRLYKTAERYAARRCHRIIGVADAMREKALEAGIGRPEQYATIRSGMEVECFLEAGDARTAVRRELGIDDSVFLLGTVARLAELKGHDDLLDSLGDTMRERPELHLLWVGDGWWRSRLLKRVASLGLSARVHTPGLVPPEEVARYMHAMDTLAHPSYREGLPRTVPQALLCGVPVVVYDVDGASEVCQDGMVGRLIEPGDRNALRAAIEWMMGHPTQRAEMGVLGRERCREAFAATTMVRRLEELYEEVLGRCGGGGDHTDLRGPAPGS